MRIGLIPGSFKPYHKGHDDLIRLAADENENDFVRVYNSTADRGIVKGKDAIEVINRFVIPTLPQNVEMISSRAPVADMFKDLETADAERSKNIYTIYSDIEDIKKYNEKTLRKYLPYLFEKGQIKVKGIKRGLRTTNISGTEMRNIIQDRNDQNFQKFKEMLPSDVQQNAEEILRILSRGITKESLLRRYIKTILENKNLV